MRVLHICIYFRNPMFMGLMKGQEETGTDKRVFYYETRKIGLKKFDLPYVDSLSSRVRVLPSPFLRFVRLKIVKKHMFELYRQDHAFDCIHAHTLIADGYLALAASLKWGIPYVVTIRDSDLKFKPYWKFHIYRKIITKILANAKALIFLSTASDAAFKERLNEEELKSLCPTYVVPNGIDDFWHRHIFRRSDRHMENEWNIITVGKICARKNQVICCEAVKRLRDQGIRINYEIVGKPENKSMLKEIQAYGFVRYREHMDKEALIEEYRKNDIFLLASTNETFGLVYAEALSQGLPVIYTKGQGFDEQFPEGYIGCGTSSSDVNQIMEAILHVMKNYHEMVPNCADAASRFDWTLVAQQLDQIYQT